jgi:hypothetical protein
MPYHLAGLYKAKIVNAIISESRGEKKTPQFELALQLLDKQEPNGEWNPYTMQDRFPPIIYLSITDATMGDKNEPGWVTKILQYLGFDFDAWDLDKIIGWEGVVECRYEIAKFGTKAGQDVEKWSIFEERSPKTMESNTSVAKSLKAKYGKMFKGMSSETSRTPATAPSRPNGQLAPPPEADIPF